MNLGRWAAMFAVTFSTQGVADDHYAWQEKIKILDKQCEDARAAKLAPVRARLARECEKEPRRTSGAKEECALETSTYGNTHSNALGAAIIGQYYDLPECQAAAAAMKEREKSQSWKQ